MATSPKQDAEQTEGQTEDKLQVSTRSLERLAKVATQVAQTKQWKARKDGMANQEEPPSEVRNLSDNAEARAQAEASMQLMMTKPGKKRWF